MSTALAAKTALCEQNQALFDRFTSREKIVELVTSRCRFVDKQLIEQWQAQGLNDYPIALIAVGGYGRGELHPYSDIDLLFLVDDNLDPAAESRLSAISPFSGTQVLKSATVSEPWAKPCSRVARTSP